MMEMDGPMLLMLQLATGLHIFVPILLEDMRNHEGLHVDVRVAIASRRTPDETLLLPGWQTGVWWIVFSLILWALPLSASAGLFNDSASFIAVPAISSIFFPFVIIRAIGFAGRTEGILAMTPGTAFVWYITIIAFSVGICIPLDDSIINPNYLVLAPPMQLAWAITWTTPSSMRDGSGGGQHWEIGAQRQSPDASESSTQAERAKLEDGKDNQRSKHIYFTYQLHYSFIPVRMYDIVCPQ
jgi:hypothetical protein